MDREIVKVALVGLWLVILGYLAFGPDEVPTKPQIPACASDDGTGPLPCRWDAQTQGNGEGRSFTVLATGEVVYG